MWFNTDRYCISIEDEKRLIVKANRFQEKPLIYSPIIFSLFLFLLLFTFSTSLSSAELMIVLCSGLIVYFATMYLVKQKLWDTIETVPPFFYGLSLLITTLVGLLVPILVIVMHPQSNHHFQLLIELAFLFYSVVYFISLSVFMISIQSETIFHIESGDAVYKDQYLIFPYMLERTMYFKPDSESPLQMLVKTLKLVNNNTSRMSRTSIAYSLSKEEFAEYSNSQTEFLVALYDPQNNPVIESVLCFRGKKDEVEQFFEIIQSHIDFVVKKIADAKIITNIYGNAKSKVISD